MLLVFQGIQVINMQILMFQFLGNTTIIDMVFLLFFQFCDVTKLVIIHKNI